MREYLEKNYTDDGAKDEKECMNLAVNALLEVVESNGCNIEVATMRHPLYPMDSNTGQGMLNQFETDSEFTELLLIQMRLCVMCVFVFYSRDSLSS